MGVHCPGVVDDDDSDYDDDNDNDANGDDANDDDDDANGDDGCHPGVQSSCKVRLLTFSTLEC